MGNGVYRMFEINDYVVYSTMGVYKIIDIRKEIIGEAENDYYILKPVFDNNLTVKIPVNNPNIPIRKVISREDAMSIIKSMTKQKTAWIDDNKERSLYFRAALKSCECSEWAKLLKTIYLEKQEKTAAGKKLMKQDEDIMKSAEKNLCEELAVALDLSPDEVVPFIIRHVS